MKKFFRKIKKSWNENRVLFVLMTILVICVILIISVVIDYFLGTTKDKYGDRLEGIKKVAITDKKRNELESKIAEDEKIDKCKITQIGKIIYIDMEFTDGITLVEAQGKASNSIDQNMYKIYCNETKKRKIKSKKKQKKKENKNGIVSLSKIKKIEGFTKAELKNICYEKLKSHFFIDVIKRNVEKEENQVIIELTSNSSSTSISEENISIIISEKEDIKEIEEKNDENKLNIPILE